jgi:iron(III) transport system permease protein
VVSDSEPETTTVAPAPLAADPLAAADPAETDPVRAAGSRSGRPPLGLVMVAAVVAALFVGPLLYVVWRNISLGGDLAAELFDRRTVDALLRTVLLAVLVSASAAVVGTGMAWLVARTDLPGRRWWRVLAPLPLVFPSFVGAAALLAAFARGGMVDRALDPLGLGVPPRIDGLLGAWLVLVLFTYPYVYLPVVARMASLPSSLEESARLLGHGPWSVFRTVVLPQTRVAVAAGTLLVFLYTVSDFGAVALMRYDTLTVDIFANRLADQARSFALALALAVLALTVVMGERAVARRRFETEVAAAGRALLVPLGRWRWPAIAAVALFLGNALLGPIAALGYWAARGLFGTEDASGAVAADLGDLMVPAFNTSAIGLITAVVAVVVVLPLAYLTVRYRTRFGGVANTLVVGGFALPGLVIALSLVFWALNAPGGAALYQTIPLLVFAYVVHFGAQSMRAGQVAVGGVPSRLDDAARMLGAGRTRRFLTVELPLMMPGLLAGGGLVLLSTMKELPATLLLRPTRFETLAVRIWNASEDGFLAEVGLASLVLVLFSGVLTWLLVTRRQVRFS